MHQSQENGQNMLQAHEIYSKTIFTRFDVVNTRNKIGGEFF